MRESTDLVTKLTLDECVTLLYIATEPDPADLSDEETERLIQLGLARISRGRLAYTDLGQEIAMNTMRLNSSPSSAFLH